MKGFVQAALIILIAGFVPALAQQRLLPHVPRAIGGFAATLALQNDSALPKTVTFTAYNADGEILADASTLRFSVDGISVLHLDAFEALPEDTAYVTVGGSEFVQTSLLYRTADAPNSARAVVDETSSFGKRFHLLPTSGDTAAYWEGLAVVNSAADKAAVTATLHRGPETVLDETNLTIAAGQKILTLFGELFPEQTIETGDFIRIQSDRELAIVVLHGNLDSGDLTNVTPDPFFSATAAIETGNPQDLARDPFEILNVSLQEEFLKLQLRFPNGCTQVRLVWSGAFKESFPVQADLHIAHDTSDLICTQAFTTTEANFDLAPLVMQYTAGGGDPKDTITLNIVAPDGEGFFTTISLGDTSGAPILEE